jgi:hypothetical protein
MNRGKVVSVQTMKKIYRSRVLQCILVIGIALLLVAGVVTFTHQLTSAHAQAPGQSLATKKHSSTRGCSSVDGISNGDLDAALYQCGDTGSMFKATVVNWGAASTTIKAGFQNQAMSYTGVCNHFACSTPQFAAKAGDVICYQAFAGSTQTDVECYTVPSDSSSSSPSLLK